MTKTINFTPRVAMFERHPTVSWQWRIRVGYDRNLTELLKKLPGAKFDRREGCWTIPDELRTVVQNSACQSGFDIQEFFLKQVKKIKDEGGLHPHQQTALQQTVSGVGNLISFEFGIGKTATAIAYLKRKGTVPALIVAPKLVLRHWQSELEKWELRAPVRLFTKGAELTDAANALVQVALVPYSLLSKVPDGWLSLRTLIFDEAHFIKERRSKQGKAALAIRNHNPYATVLALTATPIANEPIDLWSILDIIWPGRFGTYWQFAYRYCNVVESGYGKSVSGLNERHSDEFNSRLAAVSSSVTRAEVAHLLPKCNVSMYRAQPDESKVDAVRRWLTEAPSRRRAVLTYNIETAKKLERAIPHAALVTGKRTVDQRHVAIEAAKRDPEAVLVASMKSIGVGIELTEFTEVLFAETYWSPAVLLQALGRFNRLSSNPLQETNLAILYLPGTKDEVIAHVVQQKIKNILDVTNSTGIDSQVSEAIDGHGNAEEDEARFLEEIERAASNFRGGADGRVRPDLGWDTGWADESD